MMCPQVSAATIALQSSIGAGSVRNYRGIESTYALGVVETFLDTPLIANFFVGAGAESGAGLSSQEQTSAVRANRYAIKARMSYIGSTGHGFSLIWTPYGKSENFFRTDTPDAAWVEKLNLYGQSVSYRMVKKGDSRSLFWGIEAGSESHHVNYIEANGTSTRISKRSRDRQLIKFLVSAGIEITGGELE